MLFFLEFCYGHYLILEKQRLAAIFHFLKQIPDITNSSE